MSIDNGQTKLYFDNVDFKIPRDHKARFFVDYMSECYEKLGIEVDEKKSGRPSYNLCSMLKLIVYARINHINSAREIEDLARYHDVYKFVCDSITPDERTILRYKQNFKPYYDDLLKMTLDTAEKENLTDFTVIATDGTVDKAYNNLHNRINEKETDILLSYFKGEDIELETLEELHKPAKKFMNNNRLNIHNKIMILQRIKEQFKTTEQEKIPINDVEARKMKGKRGNFKIAYNVQSAVDCESKLICAITVSSNPTDHYEIPSIVDKTIKNTGKVPEYVLADTIYLNPTNLSYLLNNNINGVIPDRKQSKLKNNKLNSNPYHKDHFDYDSKEDRFKCPEGKYLNFYKEYTTPNKDNSKPDKITRIYNNYSDCKNCKQKNKCFSGKQTHRTITENGNRLQLEMKQKMETEEYKELYNKRSCVEAPFGTFKIQYNMENEIVIGKYDTECFLTLNAVAYNFNRLYKLLFTDRKVNDSINEYNKNTLITTQTSIDSIIA